MIHLYHHHPQPMSGWLLISAFVAIFIVVGCIVLAVCEYTRSK